MKKLTILILTAFLFTWSPGKVFAQVLETEESKPLSPGQWEIGSGLEFQRSKEGTETALPLSVEYGLSKKFTLLVEPVGFTHIKPKTGTTAKGIGDLEITLFYQLLAEKGSMPSISISAEVKIPTAKNSLIGTGKTDITPYLIMSKTTGHFFTSLNLSYTFLGKPAGVTANNVINYALGTIYTLSPKNILFTEFYGNTAAIDAPESIPILLSSTITTQEISGGENVFALGFGHYIRKEFLLSMGISYDNKKAMLFRPGFEWKFGGRKNK